ncbi:MAG: hypothetical protein IJM29_04075 [Bacteroidales bacterium]|nr:hypothetical protein [Bacteroidales bacterium]
MKKIIYILFAALIGAVSCTINGPEVPQPQDGKVTIMMKVTFPEVLVSTKGTDMADTPNIDNIYVATFGTNHYLNDYVKAVPCDSQGNKKDSYGELDNNTDFFFKVTLSATTSKRYVHVFANAPSSIDFGYEDEIMKTLTTEGTVGSYWTYIVLPHGTATIDDKGVAKTSEEAEELFHNLKLIRNFARIKLDIAEGVNFELTGYKVYNTPTHGSVAVWSDDLIDSSDDRPAATGFFKDYYEKDLTWLLDNYDACMPNDEISTDTPSTSTVYDKNDKYVYERPDAESSRPYIIMAGKFNGDRYDTYYKLELVDPDGNYLPILRNHEYLLHLNAVSKRGTTDPTQAKVSNANVSSMTETENLSDLSNGISRIYVQWLDRAYMAAGTQYFQYKYLPVATQSTPAQATLSIISGEGEAINGSLSQTSSPDAQGWYTVTFTTNAPSTTDDTEKITKFRVTGTHDDQKLYRDITVRLLPYLTWGTPSVTASGGAVGTAVNVTITLKTGLPASIFPLEISFEDRDRVLDPAKVVGGLPDMTAVIGPTIVAGKSGQSYQFVKTISYLDYQREGGNVIICRFERVKANDNSVLYFKNQYFQNVGSVNIPAGAQN